MRKPEQEGLNRTGKSKDKTRSKACKGTEKRMMKQKKSYFIRKEYLLPLLFTAVLSFGYLVTHEAIGIDDTAVERYLEEGLEPVMGRWVLFVLNRLLQVGSFAPFVTEAVSVLLLMGSVTLWMEVFRRVLEERVEIWCYTFAACIFLSSPILSEVYTYYLHNGISLAYGFAAAAALFFLTFLQKGEQGLTKVDLRNPVAGVLCLTVAVGCYESMLIVFVIGMLMLFGLIHVTGQEKKYKKTFAWAVLGVLFLLAVMLLRSLIIKCVVALYGLNDGRFANIEIAKQRSILEVLQWIGNPLARSDFAMLLKRYFVMYYVNAICYFPVTIFVLGVFVCLALGIFFTIRQRKGWLLVSILAFLAVPWCMLVIEGYPTHYRASQYVPLVCAYAVLLFGYAIRERGRILKRLGALVLAILVFNQATEMNRWFYVDELKYQDAVNTIEKLDQELKENYSSDKPVIFCGTYEVPKGIIEMVYLTPSDRKYQWIKRILDPIDIHLMEKYFAPQGYGYYYSETPLISVLDWGVNAFDETNVELLKFMEMHGHSFLLEKDPEKYRKAEEIIKEQEMPGWPKEGSILETEEFIVVNFG